jgi:hypothetical protein
MTQKNRVADENLATLFRREHELNRRILEGTLNINLVLSDLQNLIEGKSFSSTVLSIPILPSLSERIIFGQYDNVDPKITEKNFPEKATERYHVEYKLFLFEKNIWRKSGEIAEIKKEGFEPANIHELLQLGGEQPNLQKQFPIIALGSVLDNNHGSRDVPVIDCYNNQRRLLLYWFGHWHYNCRFLGVRRIS